MARSRAPWTTVTDEELTIFENSYSAAVSFYDYVGERLSWPQIQREITGVSGGRGLWVTSDRRAQILARNHPIMFARWLALYRMGMDTEDE